MMVAAYKNVHTETTRHGAVIRYYRAKRGKRIRLPDDPGSVRFKDAVRFAAIVGEAVPRPRRETKIDVRKREVGLMLSQCTSRARQRARERGLGFDIDLSWAIDRAEEQDFRCAMTNIPFYFDGSAGVRNPYAPSLDRIDCKKGYTKTNVRLIICALNTMLSDWGPDLFERVATGFMAHKRRTSIPAPSTHNPAPVKISNENKSLELIK